MALSDCVVLTATEPIDSSLAITVTLTAIVLSQGGVNVPALQGTWSAPTDTRVLGVQFEYQESGANASRTAIQGVGLTKWVATDGLIAGKTYAVRYRAVGLETYGDWTTPANKTLSSTLTASEIVNQGDLAVLDQVDTPQLVNKAAIGLGYYYSDANISQVNSTTTVKEIGAITITVTDQPLLIMFGIVDQVSSSGSFEYYVSYDSTITHNGSAVSGGPIFTMPQDTGSGNTIKTSRGISFVYTGHTSGSHTFKLWVRNATGANWQAWQRTLSVTELKKSV